MRFKYSGVYALSLAVLTTGCSTSNGEYRNTPSTASTTRNASTQVVGVSGNQMRTSDSSTIKAATPSGGDVTQAGGSRADATSVSTSSNYRIPGSDISTNDKKYIDDKEYHRNIADSTEGNSPVQQENSVESGKAINKLSLAIPTDKNEVSAPPNLESFSSSSIKSPAPIDFRWPVSGRIVEGFGKQSNGKSNNGIYLAAPVGTPVLAASDGTVIYAGSSLGEFGNLVLVQHENDWVSAYAHNDTINVSRGEVVKRGQNIATVGQTGKVSSPQLHFELRKNAKPVDPLPRMTDG